MKITEQARFRFESLFGQGVDPVGRVIYLWQDVEESSIAAAGKGLLLLDSINEEPITLVVSTRGGDEYEMMGIYDIIKSCRSTIQTVGVGKVLSAGPLILAAGTKGHRYVYPTTQIMLHKGNVEIEGPLAQVQKEAEHMCDLHKLWVNVMAKETGTPKRHWQNVTEKQHDVYIDAKEAIKTGIVDKIYDGSKRLFS